MWQSLIVGTFPSSMTDSHQQILNRALEIGQKAEKDRELMLVKKLITQAAKQAGAVLGVESTLKAVNEGRVQTLVIKQGFKTPGYRCPNCNTLTSLSDIVCKQCSTEAVEVADVISTAVSLILKHGGEVDVIHSPSDLVNAGNIGAFLRY